MKRFFKKHRQLCLTTVTVCAILLLVGCNILFPYLNRRWGLYPDMTPEGLYTLTNAMKETCGKIKGDVTITFCDEPDRLLAYRELRYVYVMAVKLSNLYDNFHVETVNLVENPTAVNRFKTTSASRIDSNDVIVSCGERYRKYDSRAFWALGDESVSDTDYIFFNGEYTLATAILSVSSITEPVVCFTYNHGENIYVAEGDEENKHLLPLSSANGEGRAFYDLLRSSGLKVKYVNLDTEEIDKDCVLVVMNGPTVDYVCPDPTAINDNTALSKLHNFMAAERPGALMVFKDPMSVLPNLENFSADWGIRYENGSYIQGTDEDTLMDASGKYQKLIVTLNPDQTMTPYSIFGSLLTTGEPPRTIVEDGGRVTSAWGRSDSAGSGMVNVDGVCFDFMYSGEQSIAVDKNGLQTIEGARAYALAALSMRIRHDEYENTDQFAYYFGAASTSLTKNAYLEDTAFSNYDVMSATVRHISRIDEYASMELGGTSLNSPNLGGKPLVPTIIPETGYEITDYQTGVTDVYRILTRNRAVIYTVIFIAIPLIAASVTGTVMLIKRKNR